MSYRTTLLSLLIALPLLTLSACADDADTGGDGDDGTTVSRDEARRGAGKTDSGVDICGQMGWYGDGICDPFCVDPDPDCDDGADPCEDLGWYGDGICDSFCPEPDPDCEADRARGEGEFCGGIAGFTCAEGLFCNQTDCGTADQGGTCEARPEVCTEEFAPVCGCDGQTYGNACNAASAGVSVASEGECELECDEDADCPADTVCIDNECRPNGLNCPAIFDPVCGTDGNTYSNACQAGAAGVDVAHEGECEGEPECVEDADCPADTVCIDNECRPNGLNCPAIFDPVCGTDGNTYSNSCQAGAAGVDVAHEGECDDARGEGEFCGGIAGFTCADDLYCNQTDCGVADQGGTCEARPEACTQEFAPVCGCDGQTYGNACSAASAGVSVASDGECE